MIPFEFTRPWILLAIVPLATIIVWYFARSLSDFPKPQRIFSMLTRMAILLLLVLSLAGLTWLQETDQQCVIFLQDKSLSVGRDGNEKSNAILKQAIESKGQNKAVLLPFAAKADTAGELTVDSLQASVTESFGKHSNGSSETTLGPPLTSKPPDNSAAPTNITASTTNDTQRNLPDGTNLAAAIEAAAGYMPPGFVPKIVLLTDGNQTTGDLIAAAVQSRIPVSTVPLPTLSDPEVQVAEVNVPAEVREGEPFFVEVIVQSNHDDQGLIEVFRGDHKVISETKSLKAGANEFRFQQSIERDRLAAYSVRISELKQDTLLDNNSEAGMVYASGKPRVLIIESDPSLIRELAYALEDEGIQVDVRPPQGLPETLADLQNYGVSLVTCHRLRRPLRLLESALRFQRQQAVRKFWS